MQLLLGGRGCPPSPPPQLPQPSFRPLGGGRHLHVFYLSLFGDLYLADTSLPHTHLIPFGFPYKFLMVVVACINREDSREP